MEAVRIGLIGDHSPKVTAHAAIPAALRLAASELMCELRSSWLPTDFLHSMGDQEFAAFCGFWCVPGSPYNNLDGALRGIRFARENGLPFLGTCGGFQHAVVEFARNALGISAADHAEYNPHAPELVISPLACSLIEVQGLIRLVEGTRVMEAYQRGSTTETYHCSFGLNPAFRDQLAAAGLVCSGFAENGEVRAIELRDHPFFVATLYQPERSALTDTVHPLVTAFVRAAIGRAN